MSKKKITCLEYFKENIAEELFGFKTLQKAWNFCESQYKSEIEELKAKFSEATKTYTDELDEAVLIIEYLCSSVEECQEIVKAKAFLEGVKGE